MSPAVNKAERLVRPEQTFSALLLSLRRRSDLAVEGEALLAGRDRDPVAVLDRAGEDQLGQRVLHDFWITRFERPRAIGRVLALLGEPVARRRHRA